MLTLFKEFRMWQSFRKTLVKSELLALERQWIDVAKLTDVSRQAFAVVVDVDNYCLLQDFSSEKVLT